MPINSVRLDEHVIHSATDTTDAKFDKFPFSDYSIVKVHSKQAYAHIYVNMNRDDDIII